MNKRAQIGGAVNFAIAAGAASILIWMLFFSGFITSFSPESSSWVLWVILGVTLAFFVVGGRRR